MRRRWLALVAILAVLVLVSCGEVKPRLEPEVSEVWHWPWNQSQREINSTTTAANGDRVWTEEHGRALLKWPDLWVRLYDDTQLQLEECGVATDVCVAMALGTALNGGVSSVDERISWTTSHAEIILTGTTVMVAYHPETQYTIVRVFDGVVRVRNLMGDVQTVRLGAGQWALVAPRQPPQVSDRLDEMRSLARDLGLWDVFHEVERDVQGGFGPRDSQVPPEDVVIVFVDTDPDADGLTSAEEEEWGTDPQNPDTDGDNLSDGEEAERGTDPLNPDSDDDGLPDGHEALSCTDPLNWDTDGDGRSDGAEAEGGTNPCDADDERSGTADDDGDGLINEREWELGTDAQNPDSDGDRLSDGDEVRSGTDPLNPDSDDDGLADGQEHASCTDALNWDTDGDGRSDGKEVALGTDPCDPRDERSGQDDDDDDGLINSQEWELGTDPQNPDTDGDDLGDGLEVGEYGTDPLNPDTDDDMLVDGYEAGSCSNPLNPDTDGDGWGDGEEAQRGTNPCQADTQAKALPDLTVEILSIDKQQIAWGQEPWSWIHYRVCNVGDAELPAGPIYLRDWTNGSPTSGYMVVEGPLAPDSCTSSRFAVGHDNSWPPGRYAVQLEVDYGQLIEEHNEDNNFSDSIKFVVVKPGSTTETPPETTSRIVFVSERTGSPQIWVMNSDGSDQRQLTNEGHNQGPSWSPDNSRILFESNRDRYWRAYVMNADGSEQQVLEQERRCVSPAYSSTGFLSYACLVDGNWELFIQGKRITYNETDDRLYAWSPKGDRIVYEALKYDGQYRVLTLVDAGGGDLLPLTDSDYVSWNAVWSPGADRLVFASNRDGNAQIFTMLPNGEYWEALTSAERFSQLPTWSPDGQWISFVSNDPDEIWSLYRIDTSGYKQTRLARYAHPGQFPSWSPDSERLAFASDVDGDFEIYAVKYDGSNVVALTNNSSDDHSPRWSR